MVRTRLTSLAEEVRRTLAYWKLLTRGARNLASSQWLAPEGLNVYDILRHDTLILTQASAKQVEQALKAS